MSTLFDTIPYALFNPLAATGAPVYVEILLRLLDETQRHHLPLARESVLYLVQEVLDDPTSLAMTAETAEDNEGTGYEVLQARAGAILRYLTRTGWLREETQADYSRLYILPDYAFRLLRTLREIAGREALPLAGLICSIHALLQATLREGNAHLYLPEAHRQTLFLLSSLKELQHSIGLHLERVLQQVEAKLVLEQLFFTYQAEVVDQAYHQLRTTDHVSRYRPTILAALSELTYGEQMEQAAQRLRLAGSATSVEEAATTLLNHIREIREQFEALDQLLQTIDTRHSQFVDSAVRTVQLHLTASTTTSGQLHRILSHLLTSEQPDGAPAPPPVPPALLHLFHLSLVDSESLTPPSRATPPFEAEVQAPPTLSEEQKRHAEAETLRHLTRAVSRERVRRLAAELLGGQESVSGDTLPLDSPDELALLIYLRAYGDGTLGYEVQELPEAGWVERGGIGFRNFVLRRTSRSEG